MAWKKQVYRDLKRGYRVNHDQAVHFNYNGQDYWGLEGDSVLSALLANRIHYINPRKDSLEPIGLLSDKTPNAQLVQILYPNQDWQCLPASLVQLQKGMKIFPFYAPSLAERSTSRIKKLLKSVMSPATSGTHTPNELPAAETQDWVENFYQSAFNKNNISSIADIEKIYIRCDLLIIGGGISGLAMAAALAKTKLRIALVEETSQWGGVIDFWTPPSKAQPIKDWLDKLINIVETADNITCYRSTKILCQNKSHGILALHHTNQHTAANKLYIFWTEQTVMATGITCLPLSFPGDHLPGISDAQQANRLWQDYGILLGNEVIFITTNNSLYNLAFQMAEAGHKITALLDTRPASEIPNSIQEQAKKLSIPFWNNITPKQANGTKIVQTFSFSTASDTQDPILKEITLNCDAIISSAGWIPTTDLGLLFNKSLALKLDKHHIPYLSSANKSLTYVIDGMNDIKSPQELITKSLHIAEQIARAKKQPLHSIPDLEISQTYQDLHSRYKFTAQTNNSQQLTIADFHRHFLSGQFSDSLGCIEWKNIYQFLETHLAQRNRKNRLKTNELFPRHKETDTHLLPPALAIWQRLSDNLSLYPYKNSPLSPNFTQYMRGSTQSSFQACDYHNGIPPFLIQQARPDHPIAATKWHECREIFEETLLLTQETGLIDLSLTGKISVNNIERSALFKLLTSNSDLAIPSKEQIFWPICDSNGCYHGMIQILSTGTGEHILLTHSNNTQTILSLLAQKCQSQSVSNAVICDVTDDYGLLAIMGQQTPNIMKQLHNSAVDIEKFSAKQGYYQIRGRHWHIIQDYRHDIACIYCLLPTGYSSQAAHFLTTELKNPPSLCGYYADEIIRIKSGYPSTPEWEKGISILPNSWCSYFNNAGYSFPASSEKKQLIVFNACDDKMLGIDTVRDPQTGDIIGHITSIYRLPLKGDWIGHLITTRPITTKMQSTLPIQLEKSGKIIDIKLDVHKSNIVSKQLEPEATGLL